MPPEHFRVDYAINPWMDLDSPVDPERALAQWDTLERTLVTAGAVVERIAQLPEAPDMVYAMNYGLVDGDHVALTRFRHAERASRRSPPSGGSAKPACAPAGSPTPVSGPSRPATPSWWATRCSSPTGRAPTAPRTTVLSRTLGVRVAPVGVVHPALYHLDLSLCPLDERRAIVAPDAWDAAGRATVAAHVPEPLVLDLDEAFTFAANSVVVGDVVVMPAGVPVRVTRQLERWGFTVATVDVSELHKGGGSVRCMTLPLDTVLDAARLRRAVTRGGDGEELVPA